MAGVSSRLRLTGGQYRHASAPGPSSACAPAAARAPQRRRVRAQAAGPHELRGQRWAEEEGGWVGRRAWVEECSCKDPRTRVLPALTSALPREACSTSTTCFFFPCEAQIKADVMATSGTNFQAGIDAGGLSPQQACRRSPARFACCALPARGLFEVASSQAPDGLAPAWPPSQARRS